MAPPGEDLGRLGVITPLAASALPGAATANDITQRHVDQPCADPEVVANVMFIGPQWSGLFIWGMTRLYPEYTAVRGWYGMGSHGSDDCF